MKLTSFKKEEERLKKEIKEIEKLEDNLNNFIFSKNPENHKENEEVKNKIHLDKQNNDNFLKSGINSVKDFVNNLAFSDEKFQKSISSKPHGISFNSHKPAHKQVNKTPKPKHVSKHKKVKLHKISSHKHIHKITANNPHKTSFTSVIKKDLDYSKGLDKIEHYIDDRLKDVNHEINKLKSLGMKEVQAFSQPKPQIQDNQEKIVYETIHEIDSENNSQIENSINPILESKNSNTIHSHAPKVSLVSEKEIRACAQDIKKLKDEIGKVVIGQNKIIDGLINGLICDGHVLLEGVPGIAKTLTIRALGEATGCIVKRVQFTVDLLPTDIIGITSYTPKRGFEIIKGPVFTNFLIADEINRSPPKTQSALIEAMQEKIVTIGKEDFKLPSPFFVMATKNPIENIGVYTLPEAQVDRFLFNLIMEYPNEAEERRIMEQNITTKKFEDYHLKPVIKPKDIVKMQNFAKKIYLGEHIKTYIIEIVKKTRDKNFKYAEYISHGGSPRASIALFMASKSRALMEGRNYVIPEDVRAVIFDILRHRLILSYKATVKKLSVEDVIQAILEEVEVV